MVAHVSSIFAVGMPRSPARGVWKPTLLGQETNLAWPSQCLCHMGSVEKHVLGYLSQVCGYRVWWRPDVGLRSGSKFQDPEQDH